MRLASEEDQEILETESEEEREEMNQTGWTLIVALVGLTYLGIGIMVDTILGDEKSGVVIMLWPIIVSFLILIGYLHFFHWIGKKIGGLFE